MRAPVPQYLWQVGVVTVASRGWVMGSPLPNSSSCCYGRCQDTKENNNSERFAMEKHNQSPHVFHEHDKQSAEKKKTLPTSGLHADHSRETIKVVYVAIMAFTHKHAGKHITERAWTVSWFVDVTTSQTLPLTRQF